MAWSSISEVSKQPINSPDFRADCSKNERVAENEAPGEYIAENRVDNGVEGKCVLDGKNERCNRKEVASGEH